MYRLVFSRIALVLVALSALLAPAMAQNFASPLDLIKAIYQPMLAGNWHADEQMFFSTQTRARWDALVAQDPGGLGFSPLVDGQDMDLSDFSIVYDDIGPDFAQIAVAFANFGELRTLSFDMVREQSGWLVDDITRTDGNWAWRLQELLTP